MKSLRTMLLPFALLGCSGGAVAQGWSAEWKVVGVAQNRTEVLVRPESVRELPPTGGRAFSVRQVWAGFDFSGVASLDSGRRIVLFRYDCAGQRALIAAATDYSSDGAVLARNAAPGDRADQYEPVTPDTLNAAIMAEACMA
ncbi:MAG: surface-adhesin E family protein [Novosphingobium sp.]